MAVTPFPSPAAAHSSASEPLRRFLQVARGAGLRISAAEGIDAARAVDLVGYTDREVLKETLGAVLAKTLDEKVVYEETFDRFFQRREFSERTDQDPSSRQPDPPQASNNAPRGSGGSGGESLSELLERDDQAALATAMEAAANEAGIQNIRYLTQKNLYVLNILNRMGLRALQEEIDALHAAASVESVARAERLERAIERLRDAARDFVERSLLLYARGQTEQLRERMLKSARLANLSPRDLERMRVLVRRIAKRLATRYARVKRRRQRGHLDIRHTLRRNMGWGGIPFLTAWKHKRIEKPRVMVLCDVSGSVAWVSQFLLMFVYSLTEVLSDIRSFAYSDSLIEVSDVFERETFEAAITQVQMSMGYGSSNYGSAFEDFEANWMKDVTNKTSVIILGDARGNNTDPRTDIFERLSKRAKRVIWLNPEFRSSWGTGDSDMYRYAPYCSLVQVCNTLEHLERVVGDLLERN